LKKGGKEAVSFQLSAVSLKRKQLFPVKAEINSTRSNTKEIALTLKAVKAD
jgi:hypothetical protein